MILFYSKDYRENDASASNWMLTFVIFCENFDKRTKAHIFVYFNENNVSFI